MGKLYSLISALILTVCATVAAEPINYEYWFDSDRSAITSGQLPAGSKVLNIEVQSPPEGAHYFNCRVGYGDGNWGSVYRKIVLNLAGSVDAVAYEYWIDNNYAEKTSGSLSVGANAYEINLEGLRKGLHRFSYRVQTGEGVWGAPFTKYFYCSSNEARFTEYEYWLDNDYANKVSANVSSNPVSFEVDLSNFDKSGGAHYFNLRTRDGDGDWSPIYRKLLVFTDTEKRNPIIGYNHFLNGEAIGYVEVERQFVDSYMFEVNLPDSVYPTLKNHKPSFDGDRVFIAESDSIGYTMQIRTEFGWASPQTWSLDITNDYQTTAVEMTMNSKHTFDSPTDLQFAAIKFKSTGEPLYFRSDAAIALDIYRDGEKVEELTAEQVKGTAMVSLEAGEYFGVLHSIEDKEAQTFTLQLMDIADKVPAPEISFADGMVTIECSNKDAEIHYTVDDVNITADSPLYENPFPVDHNATIMAFALIPGLEIEPSDVVNKVIDSYKVATPTGEFNAQTRLLTLRCTTEESMIFYSLSADGEWIEYKDPIEISKNCTVYSKATREGYNDSEVAMIPITELANSVPAPEISFANGMVTIECSNKDAEIHYTVDDPNITSSSPVYEAPFPVYHNATIRAFALIPGLEIEPSDIVTKVIDSYKVSTPYGRFDSANMLLTILCDTENATIYYSFESNGEWSEYGDPVAIEGNGTVYAKATRDGYNDSDVAEIVVSNVKCGPVSISYNGRYVHLTGTDMDATIRYSTDGSDPSGGTIYTDDFDVMGICQVRAVAMKSGYENSDIAELYIDRYADEEHAVTTSEGLLESTFGWDGNAANSIETFRVEGRLNEADYAFLRSMKSLSNLDISDVAHASIPDGAFVGTGLISVSLPTDLTAYGEGVFSGAERLSSLIWNSRTLQPDGKLTDGLENPNVFIYLPAGTSLSGNSGINIVNDGHASEVILHYGYPYYAAMNLNADRVSMTRDFRQQTQPGVCRGWESIVLPFTPESITHETNGAATPFAAWDGDTEGLKPFWLYRSKADGWEEAATIEACTPYIISMPNSPDYVDSSNLAGRVTFAAENVDLGPSTSFALATDWKEGSTFEGCFMPMDDPGLLSLNVNATEGDLLPGSAFVEDGLTVPFSTYVRTTTGRKSMPVFGDLDDTGIPTLTDMGLVIETPAPGVLKLRSGRERRVAVTTTTGVTIRILTLQPGETMTIEGLTRDLYIVAGRKVMVK